MTATDQEALLAIIKARCAAVTDGDAARSVADMDEGVVMFDLVEPLQHVGKASAFARARTWHASFDPPPRLETRDVEVFIGNDVAFSHFFSHVSGTQRTGQRVDMWFRTTLGFARKSGRWWIVHEHGSVPFNAQSGQLSLGLQPDGMTS